MSLWPLLKEIHPVQVRKAKSFEATFKHRANNASLEHISINTVFNERAKNSVQDHKNSNSNNRSNNLTNHTNYLVDSIESLNAEFNNLPSDINSLTSTELVDHGDRYNLCCDKKEDICSCPKPISAVSLYKFITDYVDCELGKEYVDVYEDESECLHCIHAYTASCIPLRDLYSSIHDKLSQEDEVHLDQDSIKTCVRYKPIST